MFRWRSLLSVIASCIVMGALPAVVTAALGHISPRNFFLSVVTGTVYASCIAIPCWAFLKRIACSLECGSALRRYASVALALAVFGIAGCVAANLILVAMGLIPFARVMPAFWWSLRICLLITFSFGALTTVIKALQGQLAAAREQLHEREMAAERERKIAAEARFASLESRVRPHFLFNTLNSISALVREDPAQAERTIERLAALLRYTLDTELSGLVTIDEEFRIVRDYLEIERVRFGERLRYSVDAAADALARRIPALSVQTLVENSVKYAVGATTRGAQVSVRATLTGGTLRVEVSDDGPGFDPTAAAKPGHGFDLLQRRLASFFGSSATLGIDGTAGRTLVSIDIQS